MSPNEQPSPAQTPHGAIPQPHDAPEVVTPRNPGRLVRLPRAMDISGFGKSSIYSGVKAGTFPAPVRLSARAVGWREDDLFKWAAERISVTAEK